MGQKLTLTFSLRVRAGRRYPCDSQADGQATSWSTYGNDVVPDSLLDHLDVQCKRPTRRGLRATLSVPRTQFRSGKLAEVSRFVLVLNFRSWLPVPAQLLGHESEVLQFNFITKRDVRYTLRINN